MIVGRDDLTAELLRCYRPPRRIAQVRETMEITDHNRLAVETVDRYGATGGGLLILGPNGTGKSVLADRAAQAWTRTRTTAALTEGLVYVEPEVRWCYWPDVDSRIRSTYQARSAETEMDVLRELSSIPLLVLDDLTALGVSDSRGPSPHALRQLTAIIHHRDGDQLATIVTAAVDQLEGVWMVLERHAERHVVDRIREYQVVYLGGPSWRGRER